MDKKIQVLQIGLENWQMLLSEDQKEKIEWTYVPSHSIKIDEITKLLDSHKLNGFDATICTDIFNISLMNTLSPLINPYSLIIDERLNSEIPLHFKTMKCPYFIKITSESFIIKEIEDNFFVGQMGSKLHVNSIVISPHFKGKVKYFGESHVQLEGDFRELSSIPILNWQYNIGLYKKRSKKIWLEFQHGKEVNISMLISSIREGSSDVIENHLYTSDELRKGIDFDYYEGVGYISCALVVRGTGVLKVGPLHFRDSRHDYGEFILGGKKIYDENQEEIFYYFNPGDLKPPLNVYFSGYRPAEGFEGFFMMKQFNSPFLLITDPRLEGGAFYIGSQSLEDQLVRVIEKHMGKLGFSRNQLILSGLSMGTYGALYYSSRLLPAYVIVGKPLTNLGSIAEKLSIVRPDEFYTSLDILSSIEGEISKESIKRLNQRFWNSIKNAKFSTTEFLITYMKNDDYDDQAYLSLLQYLSETSSKIIGKGIPGRHNDNTNGIIQWFVNQYWRILEENYNRERLQNELPS